jgi:hypothetical protein
MGMNPIWLDTPGQVCKPTDTCFFSDLEEEQRKAKRLCANCPLQRACLIDHYLDEETVIGGTTWKERRTALKLGTYPPDVHDRFDQDAEDGTLRRHLRWLDTELQISVLNRHRPRGDRAA